MRTAVLVVVVVVALLDQVTPATVPAYAATQARSGTTTTPSPPPSPTGCLPAPTCSASRTCASPSPATSTGAGPYDEARGFIHLGGRLDWSFGATVGRDGTWQKRVGNLRTDVLVAEVAALGFQGIEVDTAGYGDGGELIRITLSLYLQREPDVVSEDGRLVLYDLRPYAAAQQAQLTPEQLEFLRTDALTPVSGRDDVPVPPPPDPALVAQPVLG